MINELEALHAEIRQAAEQENRSYYFGRFLPSTEVMFVAERPTMPRRESDWNPLDNFYSSASDAKFVALLNKHGFGGSYITDIVKTAGKADEHPSDEEMDRHFPYLLREIEIVKPTTIVAVGLNAYKALQKRLDPSLVLKQIRHPAYARYNHWDECDEEIGKLRQSLGELSLESRNLESL